MPSNNPWLFAAVFFTVLCLAGTSSAGDVLSFRWAFSVDGTVKALSSGDVDGDGVSEIVAASPKKIYVFDLKGDLIKSYPVDFAPSALYVKDIDGDGKADILVGSGWLNTSDVKESRFDFSDKDDIKEKPEYVYRKTRNQGDVYVIYGDSKEPVKWFKVGRWVKDIYVDDLDGDGVSEVLVASGGIDIDYVETLTVEIDPATGNQTYVRNRSEIYTENGTVTVYDINGSLRDVYVTPRTAWCVYSTSFGDFGNKYIIAGSGTVDILDRNATFVSSYEPLEYNYSILDVAAGDVDRDNIKEIAVSFMGPFSSGVYLLDHESSLLWEYRVSSENIAGLYVLNFDLDPLPEIVIASEGKMYVLDDEGNLEFMHSFDRAVDRLHVTGLGEDEYVDYVMSAGEGIYVYEVDEKFVKSQLADRFYQEAKRNFDSANYPASIVNLTSARYLYSELADPGKIALCDSLLEKINRDLLETKAATADSLYRNGISEYRFGGHTKAAEYLEKAREIYSQIGDIDGVAKCDDALREMEESGEGPQETSDATSTTSGERPEVPGTGGGGGTQSPSLLLFALIAIALMLFAVLLVKRSGKKKKPEDSGEADDRISKS
ncbi:MAG: VCBS repeat-containing protein [Candidatus Altiarchaeota archaeon]|nr:VCBS repeat-containing protein [Candidatus Altiarchaeota archaeon]